MRSIPKGEKTFDCIASKRQVQSERYEQTKHMTDEEKLEHLRKSVASGSMADF